MNKVKMFFIAAAMLLTTAGVFAGKAKFQTQTGLWYRIGATTNYSNIAPGVLPSGRFTLTGTATTEAKLQSTAGTTYSLYTQTGASTYQLVYTNGF